MLIRCERCSTLYELDEALLAPTGSQVQCTKCQNVFTAFPAQAPDGKPAPAPAVAGAPAASRESPEAAPPEAPAVPPPASPRADGRVPRSGPPPVYRPPTSVMGAAPAGGVGRAPVLRRDAVGSFEARLRWSARWRWLAPTLAGVAVVGAVAGWFLLGREAKPDPRARADALALVARDDARSLDEAIVRLDEAVRRPGGRRGAAADRALAQVMRAAVALEEGEALAARRAVLVADGERLRRERPPGWEDADRSAADEARALESQVRALEEQARVLGARAIEALRVLQAEVGDTADVARGIAAYHALGGDRARAERAIRTAQERATPDPWLELIRRALDAGAGDRQLRERALGQLGELASAHPELLRGRYLLARTQASLGLRAEALATLERLLVDNPRHGGALRLRQELADGGEPQPGEEREAQPAPVAAPVLPEPRPARNPSAASRKIVSRPPAGTPQPVDAPVPVEAPPAAEPALVPAPAEAQMSVDPPPAAPPGVGDTAAAPPPRPKRTPIREPQPEPGTDGG